MGTDIEFLSKVPIFGGLAPDELAEISRSFVERSYAKNNVIFFEDETGDYMYVVKEGRVKVVRNLPSGKETILAFHGAGEFFGEMSLIDGGTTPATVIAVDPTTILALSRRDFLNLLTDPAVADAMLRMLCSRCRDAWAQVEVLTFHHADARIRAVFHRLSRTHGTSVDGTVEIRPRLTHRELADLAGITRESVSRAVSRLQKEELLRVESGCMILPQPDRILEGLLDD